MRAAVIAPGASTVLRQMSGLKFALEQPEDAVDLALRALSLAPGDRQNGLHAGELLLRTGRFDEAADIIAGSIDTWPQDEVAFRLLSAAEMLRGRIGCACRDRPGALDRPGDSRVPSASSQPAIPPRPARRSGRCVRPGGGAGSVKPRRQAFAAHSVFRQRPLY